MTEPAFVPRGTPPWPALAAQLLRERRTIFVVCAAGLVLTVLLGWLRSATYTTAFSFVPQTGSDGARGGLASLAGQFGLPLGALPAQTTTPQFYADLLRTEAILSIVAADSFAVEPDGPRKPLAAFLGGGSGDPAVVRFNVTRSLRQKIVTVGMKPGGTGVVSVEVRTRSPQVSLGIAERLLSVLNTFNLETRQSQAGAERRFIEGRLVLARDSLAGAEDALQQFLEANRHIESFSQLAFRRDRLQWAVTLRQQLVNSLAQQYEDARIREVRDTPVVTVVERPMLAARPDPVPWLMQLTTGLVLSLVTGIGLVLARPLVQRERREPA